MNSASHTTKQSPLASIESPRVDGPISIVIAAIAAALVALPGISELLQFDRTAILAGEWWRMLTSHLTHFGTSHLFWDVLMFLVLGCLCERQSRKQFIACLIASAGLISLVVLTVSPEMQIYRGLSGIDTALFTLVAVTLLKQKWAERDTTWVIAIASLLTALIVKIAIEMSGATIFVDAHEAGFVPAPLAHVVGATIGIVVSLGGHGPSL